MNMTLATLDRGSAMQYAHSIWTANALQQDIVIVCTQMAHKWMLQGKLGRLQATLETFRKRNLRHHLVPAYA